MTDKPDAAPAPGDDTPAAIKKARQEKWRGFAIAGAALIFGWWWFGMPGLPDGFTEDDLSSIRKDISATYEKRGQKPETVEMMRKSSREAVGFVKFKVGGLEVTRSCTATLSDDGNRRTMWQCD